jgi:hypothetical protein
MTALLWKVALTAVLVAAISEIAKRSTLAGALLASLPLTSLLAIAWLYRDTGSALQAAQLAQGIFWLVLPSLAFFLVFPAAVKGGFGFWPALSFGVLATLACYAALLGVDRYFRLDLFN